MEKVTITVEFGNEAMQTPFDLAWLLDELSMDVQSDAYAIDEVQWRRLFDANGNAVGKLVVE